jgi:hypothetical protein
VINRCKTGTCDLGPSEEHREPDYHILLGISRTCKKCGWTRYEDCCAEPGMKDRWIAPTTIKPRKEGL